MYTYAYIINRIIQFKFTFNFAGKYMGNGLSQDDRKRLLRGDIESYKIVVLKIIKDNDVKFLSDAKRLKIPLINYLTSGLDLVKTILKNVQSIIHQ